MTSFLFTHFFPLLLIVAAAGDVLSRRISNRLALLLALTFFPAAWATGMPLISILVHAGAGLGLLSAGFILFSFGFVGGGDAKLLAAAGVWLGIDDLAPFLTMTVMAGGLLAATLLVRSVFPIALRHMAPGTLGGASAVKPTVPYGYAIAAGAILAISDSWWGTTFAQ
jgi:prepilin peptidase CpaA